MLRVNELEDSLVESNRCDDGSCMLRASGTMNVLVTRMARRGVRIAAST
jgi:hypothetical protein